MRGILIEVPEARRAQAGQRKQYAIRLGAREHRLLGSIQMSLALGTRFEPLGEALVQPGRQGVGRRCRIERCVHQLVMEYTGKTDVQRSRPANANYAVVETSGRKSKGARKLLIEDARIVDHDFDLAPRPKPQVGVQLVVGALEFRKNLLFESPRAVNAARAINRHILIELEMRR